MCWYIKRKQGLKSITATTFNSKTSQEWMGSAISFYGIKWSDTADSGKNELFNNGRGNSDQQKDSP